METILKLIPQDPQFAPDMDKLQNAKNILALLIPKADEIFAIITEEIEFVDPGEHFKEIRCPYCNAIITEDWWLEELKKASETRFTNLNVNMPCCGIAGSLNNLQYDGAAGFARFILEAVNPGQIINQDQIYLLEDVLECKLKMIIAQY